MQQHHLRTEADYDSDFFAWTQHQAKVLRTLSRLGSEIPADLDIAHVAEEIEDLGKSELNAARSLIRQILAHVIKGACDPNSQAFAHWRTEMTAFRIELRHRYSRSMRQRLNFQEIWAEATEVAETSLREHDASVAARLPGVCPFTLNGVVQEGFRFDDAVARLQEHIESARPTAQQ